MEQIYKNLSMIGMHMKMLHKEWSDNIELEYSLNNMASTQGDSMCFYVPRKETDIRSATVQVLLILAYCITSLVALCGNVGVVVDARRTSLRFSKLNNMNKYLINLALSDILIGVLCVPFAYSDFLFGKWVFPFWMCPLTQYVQLLSVFVTANILMVIAIERYLATMRPLTDLYDWLKSCSNRVIAIIWFVGILYAIMPIQQIKAEHHLTELLEEPVIYLQCNNHIGPNRENQRTFILINFIFTFTLPFVAIIFTYSAIVRKMTNTKQVRKQNRANMPNQKLVLVNSGDIKISIRRQKQKSKTIKLCLSIMLLYVVCWAPIKLWQLLVEYGLISYCTESQYRAQLYTYMTFHWLAMANSALNPLVYSLLCNRSHNTTNKGTLRAMP